MAIPAQAEIQKGPASYRVYASKGFWIPDFAGMTAWEAGIPPTLNSYEYAAQYLGQGTCCIMHPRTLSAFRDYPVRGGEQLHKRLFQKTIPKDHY